MTTSNLGIWSILSIISVVGLIIFWNKRNAVWGGLTIGAIIGLAIATIYFFKEDSFSWGIVGKAAIIGNLIGLVSELLGIIADRFKTPSSPRGKDKFNNANEL
jgi:hypothetical protein